MITCGYSAGGMNNRKRLFLRRMETLFVTTRRCRRIRQQILFERVFHICRISVIDKPPCEMRTGENLPVPVTGKTVLVDFHAQSAEISDYPAIAFIPTLQHPTEEVLKPGIFGIYPKPEQMEFIKTFTGLNAQFDSRHKSAGDIALPGKKFLRPITVVVISQRRSGESADTAR